MKLSHVVKLSHVAILYYLMLLCKFKRNVVKSNLLGNGGESNVEFATSIDELVLS